MYLVRRNNKGATTMAKRKTTKTPTQHGMEDAQTFANENPEHVAGALAPGQPEASDGLIGAMGLEWVAKLFGLRSTGSKAFTAALAAYDRAYSRELHRIFSDAVEAQRD
jgi:hypothetical protein